MRILAFLILCILLPSSAIAGPFSPPPLDKSVELLGSIFGAHIGSVELPGGIPNPALSHMFEMFNVVVISIGTIIVSHIGIVSTINTAQEGKTMGRKGSMWVPLRALLGMLLMVPTPHAGHSIVQASVMWLILQGVGAADQIWNQILSDLSSGLAINSGIEKPKDEEHPAYRALTVESGTLTKNLLKSAVCMLSLQNIAAEYASNNKDQPIATYGALVKNYFIEDIPPHLSADKAAYSGTMYVGVNGKENYSDICGKYTISASLNKNEWEEPQLVTPDMLRIQADHIYRQKKQALTNIFDSLKVLAAEIVNQSAKPRSEVTGRLREFRGDEFGMQPPGYKFHGIAVYTNSMTAFKKPQYVNEVQELVNVGRRDGWISAGSFYFVLSYAPETLQFFDAALEPPTYDSIPSCDDADACTTIYPEDAHHLNYKLRNYVPAKDHRYLANRLWDAAVYLQHDNRSFDETIIEELKRQPNAKESDLQRDITNLFAEAIAQQDVDPMIAQGKFGAQLMKESEELWKDELQAQQALVNRITDTKTALSDELKQLINRTTQKGASFLTVYGIIWICGATMAIYIPLIPYMMFTVAALGWLLLVIEAIVAAPILALSFILPAGEELGKIMQGLMLLLNIILRPTLMLFGFVLAARLYRGIVHLVNFSMLGNFSNISMHESLFASVAIICLYVMFILALSNKCFALIYALPDKILRWMGGGPEHTDASQELQQAKGVMTKGGDAINKISTGFGESGYRRLQSSVKQADQLNQGNSGEDPNKRSR